MKYYLIEIADTKDGVAKAITEKVSMDDAQMVYHQTIASAMANTKVNSSLVMIIDGKGSTKAVNYWERQTVPNEVPTEE